MHAHDRFLPEWFSRIRSRQITLPRFQRFVAWGHSEVSGLLTTVLRGLPSGAALILEVGDDEKFSSRTMVDAPDSGEKVPWCTTPIEADSSLGPDSHHPIISLSGIPSAVMVLRILHPILASTLCAANPLARIAEPTIAL